MRVPPVLVGIGFAMIGLTTAFPSAADSLPGSPISQEAKKHVAPVDTENIAPSLQQQALPDLIRSIAEVKPVKRLRLIHVSGDVHDSRAIPFLKQAYEESTSEGIRCKLLESMGKLHDPALFGWYVLRLKDPSLAIQCFAIWALGELKVRQAAAPLLKKLWSSNRFVQMSAIDALGKTGRDPDVALQINIFLRDEDVQFRFLAAKALAGVAGPDSTPELLERLTQEPSFEVQEVLAKTIGHTGGAVAAGHFIELLKNPHSQATDHWAEVGLQSAELNIVIPAIAPLLEGDDFPAEDFGVAHLKRAGHPRAAECR